MNISQAVAAALRFEGQLLVIYPQKVHDRSLKIVNVHWVFDDIIAKIVGFSVDVAFFYARSRHPNREAPWVVVAAVVVAG